MKDAQLINSQLVEIACAGRTIGRDVVAGWLGLDLGQPADRNKLTGILAEIAYQENAAGRPLLSAVVVLPEIGYPDRGFFLLARELGLNPYGDDRSFFYCELKRVHEYWKQHALIAAALRIWPMVEQPGLPVSG